MELPPTHLPERRLVAIERGAREQSTLGSKVTCELVDEVRRLRRLLAAAPDPFED